MTQFVLESRFLRWKWIERIAARMILRQWKKRASRNYDLVLFHVAYPSLVHTQRLRKVIQCPIIISEHWSAYHFNFHLSEGHSALPRLREMFNCDGLIVVSKALGLDIARFSHHAELAFRCIPNMINSDIFHLTLNSQRAGFFVVNRWTDIKDPLTLLRAWQIVQKDNSNLALRIAGDGQMLAAMKDFVKLNHLTENVSFLGSLIPQQVAAEMQQSLGVVCSSKYETFSISSAEALMCGTPLISTPIPAIMEYAGEHDAVFSSDHSPQALADALLHFIDLAQTNFFDPQTISERATARFNSADNSRVYFEALQTFLSRA